MIAAVVEYDGGELAGFQTQPGRPTVQGEMERAIAAISGQNVRIAGAGRTDAGVHATGQVVSFTIESRLSAEEWASALNGHLPPTIAVRRAWHPPVGFHARFSATARSYRYTIVNQPTRPAVARQYRWHVATPLDASAMERGLVHLQGSHDFSSFAGQSPDRRGKSNVRRVLSTHCQRIDDEVVVDVTADAFLPHMVRAIVGTLALVGRGALEPRAMADILESRDRSRAGPTAPPHGLCLVRVHYGDSFDEDTRRQG